MIVVSRAEVEALLDLDELIDALAVAHEELSAGRASMPTRIAARVDERDAILGAMPVYLPSAGVLSAKLVSLFPGNAGSALPTHQAVIVAFDPATGEPLALVDGTAVTELRTGASSALSVRLLARRDASRLALLGTGVQASSHARAIARVRPLEEIRVGSATPRERRRWRGSSRPSWASARAGRATTSRRCATRTSSPRPRTHRSRWCGATGWRPART